MQEDVLLWLKRYAKASGITQGALLNCLILRYQLDRLDQTADPVKVARIRRYVETMLAAAPEIVPNPAYRVSRTAPVRQSSKKTN